MVKNFKQKFIKIFLLGSLFSLAILIFSSVYYFYLFQTSLDLSLGQITSLIQKGRTYQQKYQNKDNINFLILGLDSGPEERAEDSLLTDTIILLSFKPRNKTITSISIPRDLWFEPLQTKTNSFYYYGEQAKPGYGPEFSQKYLSQIINQPFDFYLVVNFDSLKELVNLLGGLEINVERAFTDPRYPLPHPEKIEAENEVDYYEEIHFDAGRQLMDGERVLKFVRSRNSPDEVEGTDIGRSNRQQQVFRSLISQILNYKTLSSPPKVGRLYHFFHSDVTTNLSDEKLIALALLQLPRFNLALKTFSLPIGQTPDEPGVVLYHPAVEKYGQWVLAPVDENFSALQKFIAEKLKN